MTTNKTENEPYTLPSMWPRILLQWAPCGVCAVLSALTGNFIFKFIFILAWIFAVVLVAKSTDFWNDLRAYPYLADVVDRHLFLRLTLSGGLSSHIIELLVVAAIGYVAMRLSFWLTWLIFRNIFTDSTLQMAVFVLVLLITEHYIALLARSISRDLDNKNCYPDGSTYVYKQTYLREMERSKAHEETMEAYRQETLKRQKEQEEREAEERKRAEEEARQRAARQEAARQAAMEAYEKDPEAGKRRVWEWLNVGWNLDFPDEACDRIADYTYGRVLNLGWRVIFNILKEIYPESEAKLYAAKYETIHNAVKKMREDEEAREAREAQLNPLGAEGEKNVNYKLKWWLHTHPDYQMVASDCFSQYSANCIRIAAWDKMPEPQEIDHILVGPAGVIHIETKDYIGSIDVKTTSYWIRDIRGDGTQTPFTSPAFQVQRHETVLRHILGNDIPLHAIICLSNKNVALTHAENSDIPVVCLRDLDAFLDKLDASPERRLDAEQIKTAFLKIEEAKVRNSKRRKSFEQDKVQ